MEIATGVPLMPAEGAATAHWDADSLKSGVTMTPDTMIPAVTAKDARPILPGIDLWDLWPVQYADGTTATFDGWTVWHILSAPVLDDPDHRHGQARIRLVTERDGQWRDCGPLLPDGHCPGSREWAGSALFDPATQAMTLYYTAAGRRGDAALTFEQRLFKTSTLLTVQDGLATTQEWTPPHEMIVSDDAHYMKVGPTTGEPGFIKGFRDPAHFQDPEDGRRYMLFTASLKHSASRWNGAIGIAALDGDQWIILPPLFSADGINNELERPHIIMRDGLYYLFWSTQRRMFAPGLFPSDRAAPNGLYGAVADRLTGPWRLMNDTGLVAGNPDSAPLQTYSWWVTADGVVHGFIDLWGDVTTDHPAAQRRAQFGGTPAPRFQLMLKGDQSFINTAVEE